MKIGIPLFLVRHQHMQSLAKRAEDLGFESVWIPEHLVLPTRITSRYPYSADGAPPFTPGTPHLDPLILLAQIAAVTARIRLGTNIYLLPLRHPIVAARLAMSLDVVSNGRFTLGVGIGWLAEEFDAVGIDFRTRGARTRECIRVLKALWTESEPAFHGTFFSFGPLRFEPKPIQKPHPPIVLGGESEAALKRAAALGDGWYGVGHTPKTAATQVNRLLQLRGKSGREAEPFEITVSHAAATLSREEIEGYREAGVHRIVVLPWRRGREAMEQVERLAAALRADGFELTGP
jgi:probable F420-dependent oxidoreductase